MSYRIKRIDPYWIRNPVLPVLAIAGVVSGLVLVNHGMAMPAIAAAAVGGLAVILATNPAVSAVMATLGLVGGVTTFILMPRAENMLMSASQKLLSTLLFMLFYAVLMDGVILLLSVLYNLFAGVVGLGGLSVELEDEGGAPEA